MAADVSPLISTVKTVTASELVRYKCDLCEYSSNRKQYLSQHVKIVHTMERKFKCPFCDYAGKRQQSLKEHLIVHSSDKPFECSRCNATFRKKGHLTKHIQLHSKRTEVKCHFCPDLFVNVNSMVEHVKVEHPEYLLFLCEACSFTTTSRTEILSHFTNQHNQFLCTDCNFVCLSKDELANHHSIQHFKDISESISITPIPSHKDSAIPVPVLVKCSECGFATSNSKELENHMYKHLPSKDSDMHISAETSANQQSTLYKCSDCDFLTSEAIALVSHAAEHEKSHNVNSSELVSNNIRTKTTSSSQFDVDTSGKFVCTLCGYTCEQQRTIKAHVWKHSGHKDVTYPMFRNGPISIFETMPNEPQKLSGDARINAVSNPKTSENESMGKKLIATKISGGKFLVKDGISSDVRDGDVKLVKLNKDDQDNVRIKLSKASANDVKMNDIVKRYCSSSVNVIVESADTVQLSQNLTSLRSQHGSPHNCENNESVSSNDAHCNLSIESASHLSKCDSNGGTPGFCPMEVEATPSSSKVSSNLSCTRNSQEKLDATMNSTEEPALTLLSLLKQGRNYNPACPELSTNIQNLNSPIKIEESKELQFDNFQTDSVKKLSECESSESESCKSKSGSGICSSLLAVIEQLHERSRSDPNLDSGKLSSKSSRSYKRKLKDSFFDSGDESLENAENIEKTDELDAKYRCKLCHYSNSCITVLQQHMRLHRSKEPFECSLCTFVGHSSETLQDHMIMHCKVRMYQCKLCTSAFNYKSQLRAHMRAHVDHVPFVCKHCAFATSEASVFKDHVFLHFSSTSDFQSSDNNLNKALNLDKNENINGEIDDASSKEGGEYKCPHCDFLFLSYSGMRLHARMHQDGPTTLKCSLCEFCAVSSRSLKSHMKRHVNDQRYVQQPLEQYRCNICGYVCHHLPSLKSHMWRHASDKNYSYEFTNEVINRAIDFDSQLEFNEGVNSQKSPQFDSTPHDAPMFTEDQRKNCFITFLCCQCGFETIDKATLSNHMTLHTDVIQQTFEVTNQKSLPVCSSS